MKLPGFDGDTLVCPVGSDDSADWKPALAYPPFKKALLESLASAPARVPAPLPPMPVLPKADSLPKADPLPVPAPFPLPLPAIPAAEALPATPAAPVTLPPPPAAPLPPPPAAPLPPPPAPVAKTIPCPRCAHANLEDARFCNACGARMDGKLEDLSPVASAPAPVVPAPIEPPPALPPSPPKPADTVFDPPKENFDPFGPLDPMLSYPTEPAPLAPAEPPRRPLQPGKMGQLASIEETEPPLLYASESPALAPEPAPPAPVVPVWKRPAVLAAFVGAAVVAAGLGYMTLNKATPAEPVAELTPSAPMPMPEETPPPAPVVYAPPPVVSSPSMPPPAAAKKKKPAKPALSKTPPAPAAAAKPRRPRKPRTARAPKAPPPIANNQGSGDTFIESRAAEPKPSAKNAVGARDKDPLLEALLDDATRPTAEPGAPAEAETTATPAEKAPPTIGQRPAAKPGQFSLPGLSRPVSASDRAAPVAPGDSPVLSEPGKPAPPPGIEDEPAKPAESGENSDNGDQFALVQVHEQFDFCAQLLAQGAYGDHYDTCLCKETREGAPYRGRRGFYVTAKKKDAANGHLETSAKILSSKLDGGIAKVTARWKSGQADKGRTVTHNWTLEDGLWCQAP